MTQRMDYNAATPSGVKALTLVIGAQYSHQLTEVDRDSGASDDFIMDRAVVTAVFPLGPGVDLDGEIAYTWIDTDPESAMESMTTRPLRSG
jgi:hypothetical protein